MSLVLGLGVVAAILATVNWSFVGTLDASVIVKYSGPLLEGAGKTLVITAVSLVAGFVLGGCLAILYQLAPRLVRAAIWAYVEVFRNLPLIVLLFWTHFGLPMLTGYSTSALQSGLLALTLQSSAYLTDITRAGIQAVPRGQFEAARALGLPVASRWFDVILPQALRIMIPPFSNVALSFLSGSSLLTVLQVGELMTMATRISDYTFKPIEVMTTAAAVYFVMNFVVGKLAKWLEVSTRTPA
ncbi:MAG TPA: amino acid ABC transporter permease [Ramlibacter sp.]|uniref:amino acid ABC transporter permease n=1 Tax=Ramlibacter sp. TaxID=1917967 RepID=UPI002C17258B|nr:amino acid ABC transporter permease [Ramlibacter sp.]HVZ44109.1 amino acid ABC transporter permease [Ramlibacter sp.]